MHPGTPANVTSAAGRRDDAIVGHRLAGGYMTVHAVGQPCDYCPDSSGVPRSWRQISSATGSVKE